jgi:glutamyl endopeptidase
MSHPDSIANPLPSALESGQLSPAPNKAEILPARDGETPSEHSRTARSVLVKGRTDKPLVIPRPPVRSSALESIIGPDDRVRVFDTDLDPWRRICALRMQAPNGSPFIGTGWLAGPRTVITAGHCVYDNVEMGGWAVQIELRAGQNDDAMPFGVVSSRKFEAHKKWIESRNADYDIGCIHLAEPLGDQVGWFGIAALPAAELQGYLVNIAGYPGDRGNGKQLYFHKDRVLRVTPRRIDYQVDTYGGQSGSPAWVYQQEGGPPLVVGVHAYGTGASLPGIEANSAPLIDNDILDLIRSWIAADTPK